jgi:hypothetical protein
MNAEPKPVEELATERAMELACGSKMPEQSPTKEV